MNFSIIFCVLVFVNIVILTFLKEAGPVEMVVQFANGVLAFLISRYGFFTDEILREFKAFSAVVLIGLCFWLLAHRFLTSLAFLDSWLAFFIFRFRNVFEK